jgi:hypothetical protein
MNLQYRLSSLFAMVGIVAVLSWTATMVPEFLDLVLSLCMLISFFCVLAGTFVFCMLRFSRATDLKEQAASEARCFGRGALGSLAVFIASLVLLTALSVLSGQPSPRAAQRGSTERQQVIESTMRPYAGKSVPGVERGTLEGKVMCGYQGWFSAPGDGSDRGWRHWGPGKCEPGACSVSMWPDMTELTPDEKFPTGFRHTDGSTAHVFSSYSRRTVLRHFKWMREYGIDGAFVQRFAIETIHPLDLRHRNVVLAHCREGANLHGRTYAVMYDLTGLPAGGMDRVIDDWKALVERMRITSDPAYQHHNGKPVVAVWGVGFNEPHRRYTLRQCARLVEFLKHDPDFGGCTVMLGVPTAWRTLDRDSIDDPALHELIVEADIVSPWTVGRYASLEEVAEHGQGRLKADIEWCQARGKEYLPVVFPGFKWHGLHPDARSTRPIPRLGGKFLWQQFVEAKRAGARMLYVAMFDEVDEGTAIFKCSNDPPGDEFATFDGQPADHYLRLAGKGGQLLRGE